MNSDQKITPTPAAEGLYRPEYEHDACGVGFVVHLHGDRSHHIVDAGLSVLEHMNHRGAEGADSRDGDGAGIMTQIPHEFILLHGIPVPERGKYGTGLVFLSREAAAQQRQIELIRRHTEQMGLHLMHVREVPVVSSLLGPHAAASEPAVRQIFVTGHAEYDRDTLAKEYFRDINKGLNPKVPYHYFPDDDDTKTPPFTWRSNAHLLVANWLNYYVYQVTPYDMIGTPF